MMGNRFICRSMLVCLLVMACGPSPDQQPTSDPTPEAEAGIETASTSRQVRGWWDLGDSFGPFTAHFEGDQLVRITESLGHGDYGNSKAEYGYRNGKLATYTQTSQLRPMDPDDPHRLVPVSFELEFDPDGTLITSHKRVDRVETALDPLDEDRILGHARTLEERALAFAAAYDTGSKHLRYLCGGDEVIEVVIFPDGALLDLGPFDGRYLLEHVPSASGTKYSDGDWTFWSKGDEAFVELRTERFLSDCIVDS
jgi:membrane-bound inhibitor of C-type lysozyme